MTKVCLRCKSEKDTTLFHRNRVTADGYAYYCKECTKQYLQHRKHISKQYFHKYYIQNKEKFLIRSDEWRKKNRLRSLEHDKKIRDKASLTLSDSYIKNTLISKTGLRYSDITQEMVSLQRVRIQAYRLLHKKEVVNERD